MKNLFCLNMFFVFFTFQTFKLFAQERDSNSSIIYMECEIVKIDSVGNHYIIYAKQTSNIGKYKIVSVKDSTVDQNILVGQNYKLTLDGKLNKFSAFPTGNEYFVFSDGAAVVPYGWGSGLYFALEIKGLCYNVAFKEDVLKKRNRRTRTFIL